MLATLKGCSKWDTLFLCLTIEVFMQTLYHGWTYIGFM